MARRCVQPRGLPARFRGGIALTDGMIHQQDIRRPLGLPRVIPADRLRGTLDFAKTSPVIRGFWHRRGLCMVAEDVDWSTGSGPEVRGPGEAILMAIPGRTRPSTSSAARAWRRFARDSTAPAPAEVRRSSAAR